MDEILYEGPRPQSRAEALAERKERMLDSAERLRRRWEDFKFRADSFFAGKRLRGGVFLLCALLIGSIATFTTVYTRGYTVTVAGQELGVVADPTAVDAIVNRVETRASQILERDYKLEAEITYTPRFVERSKLSSLSGFETFLFNQVGEVMKTYVLTVDGVTMGAAENRAALDDLFAELQAPYVNENTILTEFTVPVHVDYTYTASADIKSQEEFREMLTVNLIEEATYTVERGDTYNGIAHLHDMPLEDLMAMNPDASLTSLFPGDVLTVRRSVPYLSVKTVDKVVYDEAVPSPVEYVNDDTMYQGDTKVLEEGTVGLARVSARITSINGVEDHRDITSSVQLVAPTTKVVAQGTKERPKTMPKGYFIWPVRGSITSRFGYRSIFGSYSYHQGLDIAVPYGTSIKAADGGKVTYSGWKGSYGKLVVIDHGNGKKSYYGHNSSLLVSVGEKVYQGQVIARAGSTGNSTGSHCHFEVRINNTPVNPLNYL